MSNGEIPVFSRRWIDVGFPPNWRASALGAVDLEGPARHWSAFDEFALPGGDVKGYWEPARFDGLLRLTIGWLAHPEDAIRACIEDWIADFADRNPVNSGIHWRCGQETSLRLLALLLVAHLLERWGRVAATPALRRMVAEHLERILPTMSYAIGQDNNHGTSEAAALFAGGSALLRVPDARSRELASRSMRVGRARLEERVARLLLDDGSFAQHSVNYHRMVLDTLSFAETWRRVHGLDAFSSTFYERGRAATEWLVAFTEPSSGDAPNLGGNDGTRLFALHRLAYRDQRPTLQWASMLFHGQRAYPAGPWDEQPDWFGVDSGASASEGPRRSTGDRGSRLFADGGYARLSAPRAWGLLRLPRYRFRPAHSDALHFDLWVDGENVLRDGGSFSYNTTSERWAYYTGPASHNTIQFDARDQMPRVSRFLFGRWLEPTEVGFDPSAGRCVAAYRDYRGSHHRRAVHLTDARCVVEDTVRGFERSAVLRWRLDPSEWVLAADGASSGTRRITVRADVPLERIELVQGSESRHYGEETPIPVLEVEVSVEASLRTEVVWAP